MSQYHRPLSKQQQQQTTNNHNKLTPSQPTSTQQATPINLPPTPTMQQRPSSSSATMLLTSTTTTTTTTTKSNSTTTVMPPPPPPTHLHQKQKLSINNNHTNNRNTTNHNNTNTNTNNNNNNRNTTNNSNQLSFQKRTTMTTNPTHNSSTNSNTNTNNSNSSNSSSNSGSGNLLTNTIQRFSNNIPHLNGGGNSNNNNNNNSSTSSDSTKDISQQIFYIIQFCINQLLRYDMRYELSQANKKQELPIIPNCDTIIQFKDYFPAQFRKIREQLLQSEFTSNYSSSSKSSSGGDNVTSNNHTSTQLEQLFVESFRETYFKQMNSKSGAMFGITNDHRFIVKTLTKNEAKFLRDQFLTSYLSHLSGCSSFLSRFYGLFRMTVDGNLRRFVVMNHLFSVDADDMDEMYDLKGSTLGRQARDGETTLKDQDLINRNRFFHIGPQMKQLVMLQLKNDCAFLESHKLMDYSLLVGVLKASTARKLGLHVPQLSSQQAPQQQQHSSSSSRPPASPRNNTTTTNSNGLLSASSSSASGTSSASSIRSPSPLKSHSLPKSSSSASLTRSYSMNTNSNTNTLHNSNNNNHSKSKTPPIPSHLRNASSSESSTTKTNTTTTTDLSIKSRSKIFSGDGSAGAVNNNRTTSPSTIRSLPQQKYASTTTITPVKPSSSLSDRNASPSSLSSTTNGGSNVNDIVQLFNRNRASLTGRTDAATLSDTPSSPHLSLSRSNTAPPVSMHKAAVSSHNHAVSPSVDVTPPTTPSNNSATDGKFTRSKSIFDSVSSAFSTMSAATTNLLGPREEVERSQVKIVHLNVEKTFDTISSSPLLLSNSSNRLKQISSVDGSEIYFFGLIDFLGHYDIRKMTQNLISTDREQVSSVPPEQYSLRMLQFIEQRLR